MAKATINPNRRNRLSVYLSDSELRIFQQALSCSMLNQSEFMRRRLLQITRRRQLPLSQIEIYRRLGLLQQQVETIIQSVEQGQKPTEGWVKGEAGDGTAHGVEQNAYLSLLAAHLAAIQALRAEVIELAAAQEP